MDFFETERGNTDVSVAAITLAEPAYICERKNDAATARLRITQIRGSKQNIIPRDPEIAGETGRIRQQGIPVADAIIAAPAQAAGTAVVTNHPHFSRRGIDTEGYH